MASPPHGQAHEREYGGLPLWGKKLKVKTAGDLCLQQDFKAMTSFLVNISHYLWAAKLIHITSLSPPSSEVTDLLCTNREDSLKQG